MLSLSGVLRRRAALRDHDVPHISTSSMSCQEAEDAALNTAFGVEPATSKHASAFVALTSAQ